MPVDEEVRITLRLPEALRDELATAGKSGSRSLNSEIVERLEWSFANWPRVSLPVEVRDRSKAYPNSTRTHYEEEVQNYARELAREFFPEIDVAIVSVIERLHKMVEYVDHDQRQYLYEEVKILIGRIVDRMPDDLREQAEEQHELMYGRSIRTNRK